MINQENLKMSFNAEKRLPAAKLFELLDEDECRRLLESGETVHLVAGEGLFNTGDPGGTLYIVQSGEVEIFLKDDAGQKVSLKTAESGDFFGEVSLLDGRPRSVNAAALSNCELLVLSREELFAAFRRSPETALVMICILGGNLRESDDLLRTNVARNANDVMEEEDSLLDRIVDSVAKFSGSFLFLALTAIWFAFWIGVNTLPLGIPVFDPFPFGLLTMIVSLEAIFLACLVLLTQNRQAEKDHLRSDIEYEVNVEAEMEIAELHKKVDRLNEQMLEQFAQLKNTPGK